MKYATLVIFVKEPRFGKVKTRLAKDIGKFKAWVFYRRTLKALINRIGCGNWKTVICVSPDNYIGNFFDERYKIIDQGGGDLGSRMQRVFDEVGSGPLVLVGGDIPSIKTYHINRAFDGLKKSDVIFGPATDGGYWLVGMRRRGARVSPFKGVRWSTKYALSDTVKNIHLRTNVDFIDLLSDIDSAKDLKIKNHREQTC
ncbi:MAG: TIGR04282 family arsenosugar biosynthesis glycosyltransferase [Sphingomonadales bacterium]